VITMGKKHKKRSENGKKHKEVRRLRKMKRKQLRKEYFERLGVKMKMNKGDNE